MTIGIRDSWVTRSRKWYGFQRDNKNVGGSMNKQLVVCAVLGMLSAAAHAECECRCMGGQNRPLCTNAMDLPPICAPTICPITPPSIQPLMAPQLPPLGTTNCQMRQVLNPYTRQYQWERICQ